MARGRVPPENRRRSQRACSFCRMSKKRCDGASPCHNCARRGRQATCVYTRYGSERSEGPPRAAAVPPAANADNALSGRSTVETADSSYLTPDGGDTARSDPSSCSQYMHPRMLRNGTEGEKVYIGGSAALSFLQFLRATLRQYAGPSAFTESVTSYMMLEASVGGAAPGEFNEDLDHEAKAALVKCFIQASSGFLGIFTDEDVSELLATSDQELGRPQAVRNSGAGIWCHVNKRTSLYLMLAIGAQCRGQGEPDRRRSASYFSQVKQGVFQDSLLEPSLDMAVTFILMAFYMFCASRRNTASLYLGIASRAATILGLHSSELDITLPLDVRSFRGRIWKSLRVLDLQCNALLGRPSSTTHNEYDQLPTNREEDNALADHQTLALDANFVLCSTIEAISQTLTKTDSALDDSTAESYLKMLQDWSRGLPEELRTPIRKDSREGAPDSKHREQTIGNLHVACGYYYTVMLVTRPFLVATIVPRLQKLRDERSSSAKGSLSPQLVRSSPTPDPPRERGDGRKKSQQFSETCTGAATLLVQMCHDAASLGILFDNMCILQAWIFAAGLVLGFSLLSLPDPLVNTGSDLKRSFAHSRQLLDKLSRLSPQARRFHEILSYFSDALEWYEGQRRRQHQPTGPSYLEQILRPEENPNEYSSSTNSRQSPGPFMTAVPIAGDGQISARNGTPGGTLTEQASAVEAVPVDESFLWPHPPADMLFAPEISDELGLALPWDEYAAQFAQDVAFGGGV